jgi:cytochrome c
MRQSCLLILLPLLTVAASTPAKAAGDAGRGEEVYERCAGCHSLDANRIGPMHRGVFGRKAGTAAGYGYSAALKSSGVLWDEATLDKWLQAPSRFVPGSKMGFSLGSPEERADVIAFLRRESGK